jgi:Flp pilus assembly protein TadG
MHSTSRIPKHRNRTQRQGAVAVEFAIASMLLFLVIAISIEFSRANMIRHTVDNAAYEAARAGIILGANVDQMTSTAMSVMASVRARDVTVDIDPPVIDDATDEVVVRVSTPCDKNGYITAKFFKGQQYVGECRLSRDDI